MKIQGSKADSLQKDDLKNNHSHHQFPLIKLQSVKYLHYKSKIEEAEKRISVLNQAQSHVAEKLQERMLDRNYNANQQQITISHGNYYKSWIANSKRGIEILQKEIEELNTPNKPTEKGATRVRSLQEEINVHMKKMRYRIQRGSNDLAAERKLLIKIKKAEAEIDKITAEVSQETNKMWSSEKATVGAEKARKCRLINAMKDLDRLEFGKEIFDDNLKYKKEGSKIKMAEADITRMKKELVRINRKKTEAEKYILRLKRGIDEEI